MANLETLNTTYEVGKSPPNHNEQNYEWLKKQFEKWKAQKEKNENAKRQKRKD